MQTRRQWDSKTKAKIVMEGLQGRSVVDICTEYGISQSQYYKWRDIFIAHIEQPFETGAKSKKEQKLEQENMRLRKVIGDLTVELKKNDW